MSRWTDLASMDVAIVPQTIPLRSDDVKSQFRSSWASTKVLLADELDHLGADGVALQVAIPRDEFLRSGLPGKNARLSSPAIVLTAEASSVGVIRVEAVRFGTWEENLRAIALGLKHGRAMDRYGVAPAGAGYKAFAAALPMGGGSQVSIERGREQVEKWGGIRNAKAATHPDAQQTGNRDDFESVVAYEKHIETRGLNG